MGTPEQAMHSDSRNSEDNGRPGLEYRKCHIRSTPGSAGCKILMAVGDEGNLSTTQWENEPCPVFTIGAHQDHGHARRQGSGAPAFQSSKRWTQHYLKPFSCLPNPTRNNFHTGLYHYFDCACSRHPNEIAAPSELKADLVRGYGQGAFSPVHSYDLRPAVEQWAHDQHCPLYRPDNPLEQVNNVKPRRQKPLRTTSLEMSSKRPRAMLPSKFKNKQTINLSAGANLPSPSSAGSSICLPRVIQQQAVRLTPQSDVEEGKGAKTEGRQCLEAEDYHSVRDLSVVTSNASSAKLGPGFLIANLDFNPSFSIQSPSQYGLSGHGHGLHHEASAFTATRKNPQSSKNDEGETLVGRQPSSTYTDQADLSNYTDPCQSEGISSKDCNEAKKIANNQNIYKSALETHGHVTIEMASSTISSFNKTDAAKEDPKNVEPSATESCTIETLRENQIFTASEDTLATVEPKLLTAYGIRPSGRFGHASSSANITSPAGKPPDMPLPKLPLQTKSDQSSRGVSAKVLLARIERQNVDGRFLESVHSNQVLSQGSTSEMAPPDQQIEVTPDLPAGDPDVPIMAIHKNVDYTDTNPYLSRSTSESALRPVFESGGKRVRNRRNPITYKEHLHGWSRSQEELSHRYALNTDRSETFGKAQLSPILQRITVGQTSQNRTSPQSLPSISRRKLEAVSKHQNVALTPNVGFISESQARHVIEPDCIHNLAQCNNRPDSQNMRTRSLRLKKDCESNINLDRHVFEHLSRSSIYIVCDTNPISHSFRAGTISNSSGLNDWPTPQHGRTQSIRKAFHGRTVGKLNVTTSNMPGKIDDTGCGVPSFTASTRRKRTNTKSSNCQNSFIDTSIGITENSSIAQINPPQNSTHSAFEISHQPGSNSGSHGCGALVRVLTPRIPRVRHDWRLSHSVKISRGGAREPSSGGFGGQFNELDVLIEDIRQLHQQSVSVADLRERLGFSVSPLTPVAQNDQPSAGGQSEVSKSDLYCNKPRNSKNRPPCSMLSVNNAWFESHVSARTDSADSDRGPDKQGSRGSPTDPTDYTDVQDELHMNEQTSQLRTAWRAETATNTTQNDEGRRSSSPTISLKDLRSIYNPIKSTTPSQRVNVAEFILPQSLPQAPQSPPSGSTRHCVSMTRPPRRPLTPPLVAVDKPALIQEDKFGAPITPKAIDSSSDIDDADDDNISNVNAIGEHTVSTEFFLSMVDKMDSKSVRRGIPKGECSDEDEREDDYEQMIKTDAAGRRTLWFKWVAF